MIDLYLISLIENGNVIFNKYGVAQNWLSLFLKKGKTGINIRVLKYNGRWGGVISVSTPSWGYSSPIIRSDCQYTFEGCTDRLWKYAINLFTRQQPDDVPFIEKFYEKWKSMTMEQKLQLFKEDGYAQRF